MEKTYTFAGTSNYKGGETTYRFASGDIAVREGILRRDRHTEIRFLPLPRPMTLVDAVRWLKAQGIQAVLPTGHRKRESSKRVAVTPVREQADAHVAAHATWVEAEARRKADFVARMAAARAAKRMAMAGA